MRYEQVEQGRVFVIRLEDGDIVHEEIERFAGEKSIGAAALIILGGADKNSELVTGPLKDRETPVVTVNRFLDRAHEVAGVGTIFPDEKGNPVLHMHMALGRENETTTGCIRKGVKVWRIMEAVLLELTGANGLRVFDRETELSFLQLGT